MTTIRSFIAINLSADIISSLDALIRQLQSLTPKGVVRWVAANKIHLTLKFLGDVPDGQFDNLQTMLREEAGRHPAFNIRVGGLGAFPNFKNPRVIWVGVEAPADLTALQLGIETQAGRLGYAAEDRAFSPHLTLGRLNRYVAPQEVQRLSQVLSTVKAEPFGNLRVEEVCLYRSDLKPGGPLYTRLFAAQLGLASRADALVES
jgi:2'-5' RNA ligase